MEYSLQLKCFKDGIGIACSKGAYQVSEEMHASLHKQKSVRIGAASSTLFSSEI
jgi:hypothetical protein